MKTPSENAFYLSKVKTISEGGLDVHFEVEEACGAEVYMENYHVSSTKEIHPDLKRKLDELKPVVARVYHLSFFRSLMDTPEFKATKSQKDQANNAFDEIIKKIDVTGISLSGKDENQGVVITSTFKADSNQKMAINTHCIKFKETRYGFEEDVEEIVDDLEREVYAFLFKNKKAQLELFNEDGEPCGIQEYNGDDPENPGLFDGDNGEDRDD